MPEPGEVHHLELWVTDLGVARPAWHWLLTSLGYAVHQDWPAGVSWRRGSAYIVLEQSAALLPGEHERTRPGWNHIALWAGSEQQLAALVDAAPEHGWRLLFADRHPYAGGPEHHAAYLEDGQGHEVELVAEPARA